MRYTAAAGETNNVTFTRLRLRTVQVEDVVPITVAAGITDCGNLTATKVQCDNIKFQGWNVFINLGDGNDSSSAAGAFAAYSVDGGPGTTRCRAGTATTCSSARTAGTRSTAAPATTSSNGGPGNDTLTGNDRQRHARGRRGATTPTTAATATTCLKNSYGSDDLNGNAGIDTVDYSGSARRTIRAA